MLLTLVFPLCQAGEGREGESLLKAEDKDNENCHINGFDWFGLCDLDYHHNNGLDYMILIFIIIMVWIK